MTDAGIRLLLGSAPKKFFHVRELALALSELGVECMTVIDTDVCVGFPSYSVPSWFLDPGKARRLFAEFEPDAVFVDRHAYLAKAALDRGLPLLSHLRGDYWSEVKWHKETASANPVKRAGRYLMGRREERCFREAAMILPICDHLRGVVERRYPGKSATMYQGIDPARWADPGPDAGGAATLRHPCVGLLQDASIWGKAREMLILPDVMEALPGVTFYWAGDGRYRDTILERLSGHGNFVWLGNLDYPGAVREYLAEIDVYALISGIDMSPLTILEAQLMQKPVLATWVGGVPELVQDGRTGLLVGAQSPGEIVSGITALLSDTEGSAEMGRRGREYVRERFNWGRIAADFLCAARPVLG